MRNNLLLLKYNFFLLFLTIIVLCDNANGMNNTHMNNGMNNTHMNNGMNNTHMNNGMNNTHMNNGMNRRAQPSSSSMKPNYNSIVSSTAAFKTTASNSSTMKHVYTTENSSATFDICSLSLVLLSEQNGKKHQKCTCSSLDENVDCSYLDIKEIPKLISFPKNARDVSFSGNRIENIDKDTFYNGRSVIELDLSNNNIDFISSIAFKAFRNLRVLDLSHNKIWNMPSKSFEGLGGLKYLNLGYNDMVTITPDLFAGTPELRELILESNPLQDLEPKLFAHLSKLEVLSLESTLLPVIPDHIFLFTPHLKILDLSGNRLDDVPTDALKTLNRLVMLELSENPISVIKSQAFIGMHGLVLLYLDKMPRLTKIEKYAFGDLQQLQELHCSYNFYLSEIDENTFVKKTDNKKVPLSQLFLRQNSLYTISKELLTWSDAVELHIGENPLSCDCHAEWMVNLKLKNDFQNHARCSRPSHLESMSLSQLKDHKLSCGFDLSEIMMITVAVVVAVMVLTVIVAYLVWRRNFSGYTRPYFKVSKSKHIQDIDYTGDDL